MDLALLASRDVVANGVKIGALEPGGRREGNVDASCLIGNGTGTAFSFVLTLGLSVFARGLPWSVSRGGRGGRTRGIGFIGLRFSKLGRGRCNLFGRDGAGVERYTRSSEDRILLYTSS